MIRVDEKFKVSVEKLNYELKFPGCHLFLSISGKKKIPQSKSMETLLATEADYMKMTKNQRSKYKKQLRRYNIKVKTCHTKEKAVKLGWLPDTKLQRPPRVPKNVSNKDINDLARGLEGSTVISEQSGPTGLSGLDWFIFD